jgi:hypothetical protein
VRRVANTIREHEGLSARERRTAWEVVLNDVEELSGEFRLEQGGVCDGDRTRGKMEEGEGRAGAVYYREHKA